MLFDIRGRRRNVVKVVYAILALLMGLSLFILAGGGGIGSIFNSGGASNDAAISQLEDQAARIERKIAKDPENPDLLLALTRNQVSTANLMSDVGPNQEPVVTVESRQQLEKASATWSEYLEKTDEPAFGGAQLMSTTLFTLANNSPSFNDAVNNVAAAAEAQQIVAELQPSLGSLSTAALYTLYTFEYGKAEKLLKEAKAFTAAKPEREQLDQQYNETEKAAKNFEQEYEEVQRVEKSAGGTGQAGAQERLQNPLSLGGGTGFSE